MWNRVRTRSLLGIFLFGPFLLSIAAEETPTAVGKGRASPKAVASPPFCLDWEIVPREFRPDDIAAVYRELAQKPKDEFETQAQYQARLRIDTSRLYVFEIDHHVSKSPLFKYDAESMGYVPLFHFDTYLKDELAGLLLRSSVRSTGTAVGSNAFGVKTVIEKKLITGHGVGIPADAIRLSEADRHFSRGASGPTMTKLKLADYTTAMSDKLRQILVVMSADEAREAKNQLSVLVVI